MLIYLLINNFQEAFEPIVSNIKLDDIKLEENRIIYQKILESPAEDSEKILQMISNIENPEIQSHVSEILVTDYEISSVQKCIEEIVEFYEREHLNSRKFEILKQLENEKDKEKYEKLGKELNDIIVALAKIK